MPRLSPSRSLPARLAIWTAQPTRFRAAFLGLLAVVLVISSVKYAAKIAKPGDDGRQSRSAFLRWRSMVRDVFSGTNVYVGRHEYPNPPVMAIVLRPFAELPPVAGALAWFYAKVIMAVLAVVWVFRLTTARGPEPCRPQATMVGDGPAPSAGAGGWASDPSHPPMPADGGPASSGQGIVSSEGAGDSSGGGAGSTPRSVDLSRAAAVLLALPALTGDLTHNNVNIFILFLVAGCLELYRRGRDTAAGLVLGLSIACKVTPLLFLAYFAWKRAGRVVAGCLLGLLLALLLVPGAVFGWQRNAELLTDWYRLMVERPLLKGEVTTEHPNQAITGLVYRLLTASPSFVVYEKTTAGDIPRPGAFHNLLDIGRPGAWLVVKLLTLGFGLLVVTLCQAPREERQGWRFAAECGLIALGMLLLSERTWKHHAVVLLIPGAALSHAVTQDAARRARGLVIGCLAAAWLLMTLPGLFGTRVADLALVYGSHTFAFLLLTLATVAVLRCGLDEGERSERAEPSGRGRIPGGGDRNG